MKKKAQHTLPEHKALPLIAFEAESWPVEIKQAGRAQTAGRALGAAVRKRRAGTNAPYLAPKDVRPVAAV